MFLDFEQYIAFNEYLVFRTTVQITNQFQKSIGLEKGRVNYNRNLASIALLYSTFQFPAVVESKENDAFQKMVTLTMNITEASTTWNEEKAYDFR